MYTSQKIVTAGKFTRVLDIGQAHGPVDPAAVCKVHDKKFCRRIRNSERGGRPRCASFDIGARLEKNMQVRFDVRLAKYYFVSSYF